MVEKKTEFPPKPLSSKGNMRGCRILKRGNDEIKVSCPTTVGGLEVVKKLRYHVNSKKGEYMWSASSKINKSGDRYILTLKRVVPKKPIPTMHMHSKVRDIIHNIRTYPSPPRT